MRIKPQKQRLYDPQFEKDNCGVGFVVNMKGEKSHEIIQQGLEVLNRLEHRGAVGSDPLSGDGAGLLIQVPHQFFKTQFAKTHVQLPGPGRYGTGLVFLPRDDRAEKCVRIFEEVVAGEGLKNLGWRKVAVDNTTIGETARSAEPDIRQPMIVCGDQRLDAKQLELKLFAVRKQVEERVFQAGYNDSHEDFYICSLSAKIFIYKGQLMSRQLETYFLDIKDPEMVSALALAHSRYSTNTFPSWSRAQPFRFLAHNGEINTIRGNKNWMRAREEMFKSDLIDDVNKLLPVIPPGGSDSGDLDHALELLVMTGRSLPHSMMMLVPEPWSGHETMDDDKRGFYEYHASMMEPWDGPASVAFTDGEVIGAILDRNGLRPSRYVVTKDGLVVMASEVGVLPIDEANIELKGRLQPGKMFLVNLREGRIISDQEIKSKICAQRPYKDWVKEHQRTLEDLPGGVTAYEPNPDTLLTRQRVFGYTAEDIKIVMSPMAGEGQEATGSMGNDTPLAVLSDKSLPLFNYFKQLFAQVTNPAVDSIREELVMSMEATLGEELNLLSCSRRSSRSWRRRAPSLGRNASAQLSMRCRKTTTTTS